MSAGLDTDEAIHNDGSSALSRSLPAQRNQSNGIKSRKRTFEESEGRSTLRGESFTVGHIPGTGERSSPTTFSIHRYISRAVIPWSFLGGSDGESALIFANVACLARLNSSDSTCPIICIVSSDSREDLYAIEQVLPGLFSLCRFAKWVSLRLIDELPCSEDIVGEYPWLEGDCVSIAPEKWWQPIAMTTKRPNTFPRHGAAVDFRASNALRCNATGMPSTNPLTEDVTTATNAAITHCATSGANIPQQDQEEMLSAIKMQYAESLYASKAPLTYFAKGPLSRARACCSSYGGFAQDFSPLTETLRNMVLSAQMLDKKYREIVPGLIKELPFSTSCADDSAVILQSMKQTKKSKRSGLRKNGLFANEEIDLSRWWLNKDISDLTCDTEDARQECITTMLSYQKSRETQLQITIMLEALALEAVAQERSGGALTSGAPVIDVDKSKKTKKPQNLDTLLDLFVDRLSIWQTMTLGEAESSKAKAETQVAETTGNGESSARPNILHQFCVDVVIPFYGARLPEKTKIICQKLGGPKDPSPKRPKLTKSLTMPIQPTRPGAASRRIQTHRSRKTLERVLTDDKLIHRRRVSSFSRSSTEPSLPRMKREASDVPLSAIPSLESASRRYIQREVDLRATSQLTEAKLKKKARIEHELQGAIAVLKKPNARMAVKELVEAADHRTTDPHLRKALHPRRNPFAPQIRATPSKEKYSCGPTPPKFSRQMSSYKDSVDEVPPISVSRVPCSAMKLHQPTNAMSDIVPRAFKPLPLVEWTPSRGPSKFKSQTKLAQLPLFVPGKTNTQSSILPPSPKLPSHSAILGKVPNSAGRAYIAGDSSIHLVQPIQETPVKARKNSIQPRHVEATPTKMQIRLDPAAGSLTMVTQQDDRSDFANDDDCDDVDLL